MKLLLELVKYIAFIGTGFLICTILVFLLVSLLVFGQPVWLLPFKGATIFSIIFLWSAMLMVVNKVI